LKEALLLHPSPDTATTRITKVTILIEEVVEEEPLRYFVVGDPHCGSLAGLLPVEKTLADLIPKQKSLPRTTVDHPMHSIDRRQNGNIGILDLVVAFGITDTYEEAVALVVGGGVVLGTDRITNPTVYPDLTSLHHRGKFSAEVVEDGKLVLHFIPFELV
jgi:hypothetical protein